MTAYVVTMKHIDLERTDKCIVLVRRRLNRKSGKHYFLMKISKFNEPDFDRKREMFRYTVDEPMQIAVTNVMKICFGKTHEILSAAEVVVSLKGEE